MSSVHTHTQYVIFNWERASNNDKIMYYIIFCFFPFHFISLHSLWSQFHEQALQRVWLWPDKIPSEIHYVYLVRRIPSWSSEINEYRLAE